MAWGYGRGFGFGFRGWSPPWPYVGRGRGGMPRCWWPGAWDYAADVYGGYAPWTGPYPRRYRFTREEEIDFLREQAETAKEELEYIQSRITELERTEDR